MPDRRRVGPPPDDQKETGNYVPAGRDEDYETAALPTKVRQTDGVMEAPPLPPRPPIRPVNPTGPQMVTRPSAAPARPANPTGPHLVHTPRTSAPPPLVRESHAPVPPTPEYVDPRSSLNGIEEQSPSGLWVTNFHFRRSRTYAFVVDAAGRPIEIGSGRYGRVFLGQERWQESLTDLQRLVVVKMLHKNINEDDKARFRMEKELLERVQGHPSIVELLGSGTCTDPRLPPAINTHCEGEFMILEKLDMNLEERLKGSRNLGAKEDLLRFDMHDRLLRVLEYMIPIASAVEYAHLVRNVCHRDINPANILIRLPDPKLAGSTMQVRLADFGVAKAHDGQVGMTRFSYGVPGTMYFQSPEQETNILELLVSVREGSAEVEYFEDFYVNVAKSDTFAIFNRREEYPVLHTDRTRRRIILGTPYRERSESNVRAHVQKSVGRPADIYALGGLFYYLITGSVGNPKALYDNFHKFIEYERADESNTIDAYLRHEYQTMDSIRSSKGQSASQIPIADRLFGYKHYVDGNGELILFPVMTIIARAMMRNKPDSYCQAHEIETMGVSQLVRDLTNLYSLYGIGGTIPAQLPVGGRTRPSKPTHYIERTGNALRRVYGDLMSAFGARPKR